MSSMDHRSSRIADAASLLLRYVVDKGFSGYDPYDALRSPALRALSSRSKWLRIAFTQALRRLPYDSRRWLGVRPGRNPKALAAVT